MADSQGKANKATNVACRKMGNTANPFSMSTHPLYIDKEILEIHDLPSRKVMMAKIRCCSDFLKQVRTLDVGITPPSSNRGKHCSVPPITAVPIQEKSGCFQIEFGVDMPQCRG